MITNRILIIVMFICLALAAGSLVYTWLKPPIIIRETAYVKVPEVVRVERVEIPIDKIKVLKKERVLKKIDLPPAIAENPDKQITATGVVGKHTAKTDVLSILDTKTGESEIYAKKRPPPFLEFINEAEIGVRYGFSAKSPNGQEGQLFGSYRFLRVDKFRLGVYGEGTTRPDAKAMIELSYRF